MNEETRKCQNCSTEFKIDSEDFAFYEKVSVPPPTWCPDCRLQRRLMFRNPQSLYKRACGLCGKDMITIYAPEKPHTVYCQPCRWSDKWNPAAYGKEYDFTRPFFSQLKELYEKMPLPALNTNYTTLLNSDYTNQTGNLKNCYLLFNSDYDENCAYGTEIESSKDCFDNLMIDGCEMTAQSVNCQKCYKAFYSVDCEGCHDIWFSKNLIGCTNCFGCANLRNKQYHIFNVGYSKDGYEQKLAEPGLGSWSGTKKSLRQARELFQKLPVKFMHGRQNTGVTGDYITHSKYVRNSYIATEAQNCRYCLWLIVKTTRDSWDYAEYGDNAELIYEAINCGDNVSRVKFSMFILSGSSNVEYSHMCVSSQNLFGCIGLRKQKNCILNKSYSEAEYKELREKIIAEMQAKPYEEQGKKYAYGEFFPISMSAFAYNESTAQQFFPLTAEECKNHGYSWRDTTERNYKITTQPDELPDNIRDATDAVLNEVIGCAHGGTCNDQCTTAFKLIPQELAFYRRMNLPLPRLCFNCRHYERLKERTPTKLWQRQCLCAGANSQSGIYKNAAAHFHGDTPCPNKFETSYAPERTDIVYCETCYNAEVI